MSGEHHSYMTDEEWRALVRNWNEMLHVAIMDNPSIDWAAVNRVLDAMAEISK